MIFWLDTAPVVAHTIVSGCAHFSSASVMWAILTARLAARHGERVHDGSSGLRELTSGPRLEEVPGSAFSWTGHAARRLWAVNRD
jgi:hypothetical protein